MAEAPASSSEALVASLANRIPTLLVGWGGVFAAVLALIGWSLMSPMVDDEYGIFGDLFFGALVVTAAFLAAWHTRTERTTEQRKHMDLLEELSRRDELSGLHNYRYLRETMRLELSNAAKGETQLAVIMLDLNDFKDVNDRFGHQAGDALIIAIGQAIRDEVQGRGTVARYGGDEFTVVLPETDRDGANELAVEIASAIARASLTSTRINRNLAVTASYGIAVYPHDANDPELLIAHADRALYEAKSRVSDVKDRTDERHSQDVFFALGEAIGEGLDPQKLPRKLVEAVARSLNLSTSSIWVVRQESNEIWPEAYWCRDPEFIRGFSRVQAAQPFTLDEGRDLRIFTDHLIYIDEMESSASVAERFRGLLGKGTWQMVVPMPGGRGRWLLLSAQHAESAPPTTHLAEALARLLESALQNADSFAQTVTQAEQLKAIAGIGGLLLGDGAYEDRVQALVTRVTEVTGADMLTLDTDDPSGETPFVRQFHGRAPDGGPYDQEQAKMWLSLRPTLTDPTVRDFLATAADPIIMDDPLNQVPEMYRHVILSSGTRSVVVMPIAWQKELRGLFYFASYRANAFNAHDIALMQAIAAQIAPAIEVANLNVRLERSYTELKDSHKDAIQRLAYAAEARDPYTGRYLQRIAALSEAIARRLGLNADAVEAIGYAAVVHDIGKLKIPDDILTKPGELTAEDWIVMRQHPEFGAELLSTGLFYDVARTVALHHHERWDGSGYPFGLKGEDIPLEARIVAVADIYDALISARPYKHAWPRERALAELLKMRAVKICPRSVDAFLQLWTQGEIARIEEETQDANFTNDFRDRMAA